MKLWTSKSGSKQYAKLVQVPRTTTVWAPNMSGRLKTGPQENTAMVHLATFAVACKACYNYELSLTEEARDLEPDLCTLFVSNNWDTFIRFHWQNKGCPRERKSEDVATAGGMDTPNRRTNSAMTETPDARAVLLADMTPTDDDKRRFHKTLHSSFNRSGMTYNSGGIFSPRCASSPLSPCQSISAHSRTAREAPRCR